MAVESRCPELLRSVLRLEPETGRIFWRERPAEMFKSPSYAEAFNRQKAGKETGLSKDSSGYLQVNVLGRSSLVHRVVWALHYGNWPEGSLDHINRVRTDNRVANLRVLSHRDNCRQRGLRADNKSGASGVSYSARYKRWVAAIVDQGAWKQIGSFESKQDAIAARKAAEAELYRVSLTEH